MSSLRKKSGRYYARFYDSKRSPSRKEIALGTSRKKVAKPKLRKMEEAYARGEYDPWKDEWTGENTDLQDAIKKYLEEKEREVRETTVAKYKSILTRFTDHVFSGATMRDIRPEHIRSFMEARANVGQSNEGDPKPNTMRTRHQQLATFFSWAEEKGLVSESPTGEVTKPSKPDGKDVFLETEDIAAIFNAIDAHREDREGKCGQTPQHEWLKDIILVEVHTALRRGELLNLRWEDIDFENRRLTVRNREDFDTKSGDERTFPLNATALATLQKMHEERDPAPSEPVFVQANGDPPCPRTVSDNFKKYVWKAGLSDAEDLCLHSTRHTTGSWLSRDGAPMRVIQEFMGHNDPTTTQRYSHLRQEAMEEAVDSMDSGLDMDSELGDG
jgi:integrase